MKISRRSFVLGGAAAVAAAGVSPVLTSCVQKTKSGIDPAKFDTNGVKNLGLGLEDCPTSNVPTKLYTITNKNGAELCVTNFGARIVSYMVPDAKGQFRDMVLGFDNIRDYADFNKDPNNFYGAVCGRYANRISKGQFSINGKNFQVDTNENGNMLHGGKFGFHFQTFEVESYEVDKSITFKLISDDGDMGFPGRFELQVTYAINNNNTLSAYYEAKTSSSTPINISNHSYWDPCGDPNAPITDDTLIIYSKATTPVDSQLIPTGEIRPTEPGSVFDFFGKSGEGKMMGRDKDADNEQLKFGKGYDHNFVLMEREECNNAGVKYDGKFQIDDDGSVALQGKGRLVAKVKSPTTGITMTIKSTEPAVQFFDCHNMDGTISGKNKSRFTKYAAFVLEPQHFPDSPNHPNFPNTILRPTELYQSKSEYEFTV